MMNSINLCSVDGGAEWQCGREAHADRQSSGRGRAWRQRDAAVTRATCRADASHAARLASSEAARDGALIPLTARQAWLAMAAALSAV